MEENSLNGNERNALLENVERPHGGRDFVDVAYHRGADAVQDGRAVVVLDLENDGDQDVFVANYRRRGVLLRNDMPQRNWLQVKLVGTESNRDAVGAWLELRAGPVAQVREVRAGEAFLSGQSLVQHFGLADETRVDSLEVRWPSGRVERFGGLAVNRRHRIVEGAGDPPAGEEGSDDVTTRR